MQWRILLAAAGAGRGVAAEDLHIVSGVEVIVIQLGGKLKIKMKMKMKISGDRVINGETVDNVPCEKMIVVRAYWMIAEAATLVA